jgi:hypothetical protein
LQRSLGYKLAEPERFLPSFVAWLDGLGHQWITIEAALEWCRPPGYVPYSVVWSRRMTAVSVFVRYMAGIDPRTEVRRVR